ncbi:MAG: hypothetical protein ACREH9_02750 [Pseudomonadota bacterium]
MIGFGLDLAGHTTNKTSLAAIESDGGRAQAVLLRHSSFARKRAASPPVAAVILEEGRDLRRCIKLGPVAVDFPIDLQGLPRPDAPVEIWELTKRPIDKKLGAMLPFADRIGAPVARFAAIGESANFGSVLGSNLFETYPSTIWQKLGIVAAGYKSRDKVRAKARTQACKALCKNFRIEPLLENDDDINAIICAVTAVAPEDHLCMPEEYGIKRLPLGFRLSRRNPFETIRVKEADFCEWMDSREKQIENQI